MTVVKMTLHAVNDYRVNLAKEIVSEKEHLSKSMLKWADYSG